MAVTSWTSEGMDWSSEDSLRLCPLYFCVEALRLAICERLSCVSFDGFIDSGRYPKSCGIPDGWGMSALSDESFFHKDFEIRLRSLSSALNDIERGMIWLAFTSIPAGSEPYTRCCWGKSGIGTAFLGGARQSGLTSYFLCSLDDVYSYIGVSRPSVPNPLDGAGVAAYLRKTYQALNALKTVYLGQEGTYPPQKFPMAIFYSSGDYLTWPAPDDCLYPWSGCHEYSNSNANNAPASVSAVCGHWSVSAYGTTQTSGASPLTVASGSIPAFPGNRAYILNPEFNFRDW